MDLTSGESLTTIPHYANTYVKHEEWVNTGTQDVMVFHPTLEEISDFPALVKKIEKSGAHLASGICKIVPPKGWTPRPSRVAGDYSDVEDVRIYSPVKESIEGMTGCFTRSIKVYRKKMTVRDFKKLALTKEMTNPKPELSLAELERYYWRSILFGEPVYGADSPGSLFEDDVKEFNMGNLGTILDLLDEQRIKISGVNTPFLYFGMWKTTFPWHVEDMDLYSINYLHYGEPKFWYAIPSQSAERFERLACQQFPDGSTICKAFLRHKLYIISPSILKNHSIPYGTMVQYPNEIVITFPKGYHMGFNVGYNCAEAINFALERWIDFGKNAVLCYCREDGVEIDMQPFMKKYRPDEFDDWYDYWYGERYSSTKGVEKSLRKSAMTGDPIMNAIYTERQKRLSQAKRSVKHLWSTQPVNLFLEKEYNAKRARMFPHCAVCQYFVPRRILISQRLRAATPLPASSRRYMSDQVFFKDELLPVERRQIAEDELLECSNCCVVVHKRCYSDFAGLSETTAGSPLKFRCVRCYERDDTAIRAATCALCELRGGALIEMQKVSGATTTLFVHVICALLHTETRFLEPEKRCAVHRPPPKWLLAEGAEIEDTLSLNNSNHKSAADALNSMQPVSNADEEIASSSSLPAISDNCNEYNNDFLVAATSFTTEFNNTSLTVHSCKPSSSTLQSTTLTETKNRRALSFSASARYECEVCNGLSVDLIQCDICVSTEENSPAAALRYHITCAPLADMTFERRENAPYSVAICPFHNSSHVVMKPDMREITEGERVIVALDSDKVENDSTRSLLEPSNGLDCDVDNMHDDAANNSVNFSPKMMVGKGRVMKTSECLYCTVDFLDGSVSTDLYPCDIRRCECQQFGCKNGSHLPGALVYIQWHDGELYEAYYRGKAPIRKYLVRLDAPLGTRREASIVWKDSTASVENSGSQDDNCSNNNLSSHTKPTTDTVDPTTFLPSPSTLTTTEKHKDRAGDGLLIEVNQDEVFTLDEPLPEDVRLALLKRRSTTAIRDLSFSSSSS